MTAITRTTLDLTRDLGQGLRLRRAALADVPAIAEFISRVFAMPNTERFEPVAPYVRDLLSGNHPTVRVDDFLMVTDENQGGKIVSGLVLIPQAWEMDGVRFDIGRIEIVATEKDYRKRGLVRALFQAVHELSAAYGHPVQAITGIYYFYRQFGYEYLLDLGGSRSVPLALVPELKPGEAEPYTLRRAVPDDLALIARLYERQRAGKLLSTPVDERWLRWLAFDQSLGSSDLHTVFVMMDGAGRRVGYAAMLSELEDPVLTIVGLAVEEDVSLRAVMPSVLRALKTYALTLHTHTAEPRAPERLSFMFGREHAVYRAAPELLPIVRPPYAWYVRVTDLPAFLQRIAPVLEKRLAGSVVAGYTGELKLCFYRDGVRLRFEGGRLAAVESWPEANVDDAGAAFPPLVFLQSLFGHRSYEELRHAFPDVYCREASRPLFETLFPAQPSWVMPLP